MGNSQHNQIMKVDNIKSAYKKDIINKNEFQVHRIRLFETKKTPFPIRKKRLLSNSSLISKSIEVPTQLNQDKSITESKDIPQNIYPLTENFQSTYKTSIINKGVVTRQHPNNSKNVLYNSDKKLKNDASLRMRGKSQNHPVSAIHFKTPLEIELERENAVLSSTIKSFIYQKNVFELYEKTSNIVKTIHGNLIKVRNMADNYEYELYTIKKIFLKNEIEFIKDIETFLKIKHKNIREIVDYFQDEENIYIVQKYY